jgi:hypothetical protein
MDSKRRRGCHVSEGVLRIQQCRPQQPLPEPFHVPVCTFCGLWLWTNEWRIHPFLWAPVCVGCKDRALVVAFWTGFLAPLGVAGLLYRQLC